MELQQEVDVVPQRLPHPAHSLHRAGHVAHMGPKERPVLALVEERVDVVHGVEARFLEGRAIRHQLRDHPAVGVAVDARFRAARPVQEGMDGHAQGLSFDVPERDVDGGDRPVDRRALEVASDA